MLAIHVPSSASQAEDNARTVNDSRTGCCRRQQIAAGFGLRIQTNPRPRMNLPLRIAIPSIGCNLRGPLGPNAPSQDTERTPPAFRLRMALSITLAKQRCAYFDLFISGACLGFPFCRCYYSTLESWSIDLHVLRPLTPKLNCSIRVHFGKTQSPHT